MGKGPAVSFAGNPRLVSVINSLVVSGESRNRRGLILGTATRFPGVMGALLMRFISLAAWQDEHHDQGLSLLMQREAATQVYLILDGTFVVEVDAPGGGRDRTRSHRR